MLHPGLALAIGGGSLALAAALSQPVPAPGATVVLTGARVIDGTGRPPVEEAVLLVRDGRVEAVGPAAEVAIPDGVTRVDASGKTIIPGLITAHAHLNDGDEALPLRDQLLAQLRVYAEYGVTTVHTLGDGRSAAHRAQAPRQPYPWEVAAESVRVRDEQAAGELLDRARLFPSGPNVVGQTAAEARAGIDEIAELGVSVIKTRLDDRPDDMAPAVYRALIDRAHQRGLRVAAHAVTLDDAKGLAAAGVDAIVHSVRDRDIDAELIALFTRGDVGYIPTLTRNLSLFLYETTPAFFDDPFFLRGADAFRADMDRVRDPELQAQVRNSERAATARTVLVQAQRNLRRPQFSWTRIKGESDVEGGGGHGWSEEGEESGVGADGGSPEGDRSRRRRRGGWGGGLGARAAVEREPETGRGSAAAARRIAGDGLARSRGRALSPGGVAGAGAGRSRARSEGAGR